MRYVRFWHKADMLNALTNVRFGGKPDIDQLLLTNLDLREISTAATVGRTISRPA
jgi:hypothetical protein